MKLWKQVDPLMKCQGERVLELLIEHGHQAYFVGGCVRDELMGRQVHDMDIATSASPEQVMEIFDRTVPTGLQHGTVTVLMNDYSFEVTTFRKESGYTDHRRPQFVQFVDGIAQDLQRRDFTMNAIACSLQGELTDPYGGRQDISDCIVRCVGNATERFDEDALRMMRAIRFISVFSFRPAKSLWSALLEDRDKLIYIAMERIRSEMERIVLGPYPLRGLEFLRRSRLLDYAKMPVGIGSVSHMDYIHAIQSIPPDPAGMRWSLLLQGLGISSEHAVSKMRSWTFPGDIIRQTVDLMRLDEGWNYAVQHCKDRTSLRKEWIALELKFGQSTAAHWLMRQEVVLGTNAQLELPLAWHEQLTIRQLSDLNVSAKEIMEHVQLKGGPWLGDIMKSLLFQTACGELSNDKEKLLRQASEAVRNKHE